MSVITERGYFFGIFARDYSSSFCPCAIKRQASIYGIAIFIKGPGISLPDSAQKG
jgi:hypothetical protein